MYFMTPGERTGFFQAMLRGLRLLRDVIVLEGSQCDKFAGALRTRRQRVIVAPSLVALSAAVSIIAFFEPRFLQHGWRHIVTAILAHPTVMDLLINAACLLQVGLVLERLVGPLVFATVYGTAGVVAGILSLSASTSSIGASASIAGVYGLLLVVSIWGAVRRSSVTIPLAIAKRLLALAAVFVLYQATAMGLAHLPLLAALATGVTAGLAVAADVNERTPPVRRLATSMATIFTIAGVYAVVVGLQPPKTVLDVGPEISRVIAVEDQTSNLYDRAAERFSKGRIPATALVELIERTIRPELRVIAARLRSLPDVPPERKHVVAAAEEFLRFRDESWAMRAAALHASDMVALRQADAQEQLSLTALQRVKALN